MPLFYGLKKNACIWWVRLSSLHSSIDSPLGHDDVPAGVRGLITSLGVHKSSAYYVIQGGKFGPVGARAGATMQQVTDWLDKLGMTEYAQRFAENRIDLSVLPHLTDQHLKELGVALGDRLKMLHAIGELTAVSVAAPPSATVAKPTEDTAERRQLTVMFADLVGSSTRNH